MYIRPMYLTNPYIYDVERKDIRSTLSIASIADLHFGVNRVTPKEEYEILKNQFIDKIKDIPLDIISICGDIFERKFMSNTDAIAYAIKFVSDLVLLCKEKNITLIIIKGTDGHEAGQLKLFYHYLDDHSVDIRIVENIKFEYTKGAKILCIPELYGLDEEIYQTYFYGSGQYDLCFMHGTIEGAVRGNNVGQGRLFNIKDFGFCYGPIISGHVHTGGCFNSDFYYTGSALRYDFEGENTTKGFLITLLDLNSFKYYMHLEPIESFKYVTVNIDSLLLNDPKELIDYINILKERDGIDYIRLELTEQESIKDNLNIIKNYYKSDSHFKFKVSKSRQLEEEAMNNKDMYDKYQYLFDDGLSPYDKLAKYMNDDIGYLYISGDKIKEILSEKV